MCGIFLVFPESADIKTEKKTGFYIKLQETRFSVFSLFNRTKQIKQKSTQIFLDIDTENACARFQVNLINFAWFGVPQSLHVFKQNTWFLFNNNCFSKIIYIFHWRTSIIIQCESLCLNQNFIETYCDHWNFKIILNCGSHFAFISKVYICGKSISLLNYVPVTISHHLCFSKRVTSRINRVGS